MTGRRRRALVVAYCFPPNAAIGTHRTLRLVSHLVANGWAVDVLTARPDAYLPGTPIEPELLARVPPDVRVVRSGAFRGFTRVGRLLQSLERKSERRPHTGMVVTGVPQIARTTPGLKMALEELCAMPDKDVGWCLPALARAVVSFSGRRPDVIFSSGPPWTTHIVAGSLASLFRCRWVADFRDPWVRSPWTRYRSRPAVAIAGRLERWVVRRADAVVFTTESARNEYAAYYGPEWAAKLHVVFNGCDPSEFAGIDPVNQDGRFVLLHAGTLYGGRSPLPLLRTVANVRREHPHAARRIRLRFLGSTTFPGLDLPHVCSELGIADAVEFLPRVPREESLRQMRRSSALLILQSGTTIAIPGKLYEYLAAGRPVFALCEAGEMARFIREHRLGIVANPADAAAVERALLALLAASPDSWVPADPSLFDGRLRAAELAALLESVAPTRIVGASAAVETEPWRRSV